MKYLIEHTMQLVLNLLKRLWLVISKTLQLFALEEATKRLAEGTGDRGLRADLMQQTAHLRFSKGDIEGAAEFFDREIRLRRSLGDTGGAGLGLINRGVIATWNESVEAACRFFAEGAQLVDDEQHLVLPLTHAVRTLWLSPDHRVVALGRLGRQPQADRALVASRGLESAEETAKTRPPVAGRWVLHPPSAGAPESRLGLRLHRRSNA